MLRLETDARVNGLTTRYFGKLARKPMGVRSPPPSSSPRKPSSACARGSSGAGARSRGQGPPVGGWAERGRVYLFGIHTACVDVFDPRAGRGKSIFKTSV